MSLGWGQMGTGLACLGGAGGRAKLAPRCPCPGAGGSRRGRLSRPHTGPAVPGDGVAPPARRRRIPTRPHAGGARLWDSGVGRAVETAPPRVRNRGHQRRRAAPTEPRTLLVGGQGPGGHGAGAAAAGRGGDVTAAGARRGGWRVPLPGNGQAWGRRTAAARAGRGGGAAEVGCRPDPRGDPGPRAAPALGDSCAPGHAAALDRPPGRVQEEAGPRLRPLPPGGLCRSHSDAGHTAGLPRCRGGPGGPRPPPGAALGSPGTAVWVSPRGVYAGPAAPKCRASGGGGQGPVTRPLSAGLRARATRERARCPSTGLLETAGPAPRPGGGEERGRSA